MFNFFKKKQEEPEPIVSVEYYMGEDAELQVDITLPSYNAESIQKLAYILSTLNTQQCLVESVEMVRNTLIQEDQQSLLGEFALFIAALTENPPNQETHTEPCIKPSDALH